MGLSDGWQVFRFRGVALPEFRFPARLAPLCLLPLLSGCLAAAAVGGGASIGYVTTEDRSMQENMNDAVICAQVAKSWVDYTSKLNDDLNCHSYQARVLVTGRVPSQTWHDAAISRAQTAPGVKEVYDEVSVGEGGSFTNGMHDVYITQHLNAELLTDANIHSNNYIVTTTDSVVYIIGTARDQDEIGRVIDYARNLAGVKRVVSYIRIRGSAPITTGPDNANAGPNQDSGDTAPGDPTPRGDIVVTPLDAPAPAGAAPKPANPPAPAAQPKPGSAAPPAPQRGNNGIIPLQ